MSPNSEGTSHSSSPGALNNPIQLKLGSWRALATVLVGLGVVGFVAGHVEGLSSRVWQAYLVNFLFWLGIAQGGVIVAAAFYLTQARWAGSAQYRLAEMFFPFIPLGFILFWGLYFGRTEIFPWVAHPIASKAQWLNTPFLFARDGAGLFIMTLLSWWFVRASRSERSLRWASDPDNIALPPNIMRRLSPALALAYAFIYSLIGFDLIMSLSPMWKSTLFGAWFFETCFWSALVAMAFAAVVLRTVYGNSVISWQKRILHDHGKLVFAFSIFWVYLLFSQFLVIWYGDIPLETFFIAVRGYHMPWMAVSIAMVVLVWGIPFVTLLGVRPKRTPAILGPVALLGAIGIYVEDYVLVVPSLSPRQIPFGWVEILITLGFLGAFALCTFPGLQRWAAAASESGPFGED
jgi:hypothetical protein